MDRYAPGTSSWNAGHRLNDHAEEVSYDANGNIKTYKRSGNRGTRWDMDQLKYLYYYYDLNGQLRQYDKTLALPGDVKKLTNRLAQVDDAVAATVYTEDIDDQGESNYQYDKIGNLVKDEAEGLQSISWTVYGKIASISKQKAGVTTTINYGYDASGNRISKQVQIGSANGVSTFYVRDAQGNVMGVYKQEGTDYQWQEQHLYGSSRLGMLKTELTLGAGLVLSNDGYDALFTGTGGQIGGNWGRAYGGISYYIAEVLSQNEYYPFGMGMVGRSYSAGGYRYGFNGKEKSDEVYGEGNVYDYGFRIYDPRIGRFLSVDPLTKEYPWYTPYQFAGNKPIESIDLDGAEEIHYTMTLNNDGTTKLTYTGAKVYNPKPTGFWGFLNWFNINKNRRVENMRIKERYVVDFLGEKYYIGFAGSKGRGNENGVEAFREFKKQPDAFLFKYMFLSEAQSYDVEAFGIAVNLQNNAAMYGPLTDKAWYSRIGEKYATSSGKERQLKGEAYENFLVRRLGGKGGFTAKSSTASRQFDGSYGVNGNIWYEAKSGDFFGEGFTADKFVKFKSDIGRGLNVAKANGAQYEIISESVIPNNVKEFLNKKGVKYQENVKKIE